MRSKISVSFSSSEISLDDESSGVDAIDAFLDVSVRWHDSSFFSSFSSFSSSEISLDDEPSCVDARALLSASSMYFFRVSSLQADT